MKGYLLHTSVLVTLGRPRDRRHAPLRRWIEDQPDDELFTCTVVIGELARGVALLGDTPRRRQEEHWLHHTMIPAFPILDFDLAAALRWGAFMGEGQRAGTVPPNDDAKIAAVAAAHGLTVATLNARDFDQIGVPCLDPTRA